jgi:glycosyltransferase involved in cell wall biosynthesis
VISYDDSARTKNVRICLVNTFHYRRGGDSTYTFDVARLLEAEGHQVMHFAMKHAKNADSPYERFFVENIDYQEVFRSRNPMKQATAFLRSLYSFEARRKFRALVAETRPDIVHFQNFRRHLTFSVVAEAKRQGLPVVYTAHDYDPVCPNSVLFAGNRICEVCAGGGYYKALGIRCKQRSLLGTLPLVLEGSFVNMMGYYDHIDLVITPSEFARRKLIEHGFEAAKVVTVHNFIDAGAYDPVFGGSGIVYFGRLAPEKGLETLIEAAATTARARIVLAGDGPLRTHLEDLSLKLGCQNVDFLGYVERDKLLAIVRKAMCVVMPSVWFENFPYSILEAFALGKPVIASRIGGMPEIVIDGHTGLLSEPGDALALSERIEYLLENPWAVEDLGRNARTKVEKEFDPATHYRRLKAVYDGLID